MGRKSRRNLIPEMKKTAHLHGFGLTWDSNQGPIGERRWKEVKDRYRQSWKLHKQPSSLVSNTTRCYRLWYMLLLNIISNIEFHVYVVVVTFLKPFDIVNEIVVFASWFLQQRSNGRYLIKFVLFPIVIVGWYDYGILMRLQVFTWHLNYSCNYK